MKEYKNTNDGISHRIEKNDESGVIIEYRFDAEDIPHIAGQLKAWMKVHVFKGSEYHEAYLASYKKHKHGFKAENKEKLDSGVTS